MQALRATVGDYLSFQLGGSGKTKKGLADKLKVISRNNEKYLLVCVGMLVALFVVSLVLILICRSQPAYLATVMAFTGASVYGGIKKMHDLWRENMATEIALAMADYYAEDDFRIFVQGFFDRLFPTTSPQKGASAVVVP
jgi:hypothetical protein